MKTNFWPLFFVCNTCPRAFYSTSAFFHRPCTETIAIIVITHNSNIKAERKTMMWLHQRQSRQTYPWPCVQCCGAKNAMQAWQSFWVVLQGWTPGKIRRPRLEWYTLGPM